MYQLILVIHVFAAICLIALVLVQQGKGATMGAAFGSGASQTVFGSRGSGSFLLKITIGFVIVFFSTSIALNYLASRAVKQSQPFALPVPVQPDAAVPAISPNSIPTTSDQPVQEQSVPAKTKK
jgi:preprotein translocase subunit SecG